MQVTVFGSSGKVGRLVVGNLEASGHEVVAFVHKANPFVDNLNVKVIQGSIDDEIAINRAIEGSGAVVSTLGSWGSPTKDVVSSGTDSIVRAMTSLKVKRLITLTGANAFYSLDAPSLLDRLTRKLIGLIAPKILSDGERHLRTLEKSNLDWTCVRSPAMTSSSADGYRLSARLPFILTFVPRQAVAKSLVDQLSDIEFIRKAPVIYRD